MTELDEVALRLACAVYGAHGHFNLQANSEWNIFDEGYKLAHEFFKVKAVRNPPPPERHPVKIRRKETTQ